MNSQQDSSKQQNGGGSLLFQPHRTVGLLCTSAPFSFSAGSNSFDSFITVPQQERFVIYKCDTLRPVLVSDSLPSSIPWSYNKDKQGTYDAYSFQQDSHHPTSSSSKNKNVQRECMYHAITDTSLSITVAAHGNNHATHASLYKRTKVLHSLPIVRQDKKKPFSSSSWGITQIISLGRSKVIKKNNDTTSTTIYTISEEEVESDEMEDPHHNQNENGLILAFLCARSRSRRIENNQHPSSRHVNVVGESSEDESSTSDDDDDDESSLLHSRDENEVDCLGEIVIVIASRAKMCIEKRIPLISVPQFYPTC